MDIASKYNPAEVEDKWYQFWLDNGYFRSVPDNREPYCIVIPPPNVTGVLHMGHMLNNTIQDVLVRRARMQGKNALWVPGTDHASIATEAKVVQMLAEKGVSKKDLSREEFIEHAWTWTHKYGGIILEQLKKLGASCDWDRTRFTMEPSLYDAVIEVFIDLYRKGLIYRGTRMVNWDPAGLTTLSDEEVIFREVQDKLYYVKYQIEGQSEYIEVATARPETIAGDVAVCVHPEDDRYKHLIGTNVVVPLINRIVPVIADTYIDREFGTGVLKVTPAHDIHDYEIGLKFNLPVYDTLNEDGTISADGILYVGKDRFEARKHWIEDLKNGNLLVKEEEYTHNVGFSERTHVVVEPRISTQWFVNMKEFMNKNPEVLSSVMQDDVKFWPSKFKNTYNHWISNIKDWNISRQLWWGHRIPAWYTADGQFQVAHTAAEAARLFKEAGLNVAESDLRQDEDVLDTWFSSWLWPISVFDGIKPGQNGIIDENNTDLNYYYPTNDLVTAPEIIFFWVARMIMAGYEFKHELPFRNVYFTGIVRDKQRRKMSKSLGNSPDPLDLIAKYGADSVRMGMLLCSPAGNDILFDESQVEQGRNFCNKLWNAHRLLKSWQVEEGEERSNETEAGKWFDARMNEVLKDLASNFDQFRLNDALMSLYKLIWDDFCSIYLEAVKPPYGESMSERTYNGVAGRFSMLLRSLHPFMPFITEEIFHSLNQGAKNPCVVANYPTYISSVGPSESEPMQVVTEIRNFRNANNLGFKSTLSVFIQSDLPVYKEYKNFIQKLTNSVIEEQQLSGNFVQVMAGKAQIYIYSDISVDTEAEAVRITDEIKYLEGFLKSVQAKLGNEKFVANAKPDVVDRERQKMEDALQKISTLKSQLKKA